MKSRVLQMQEAITLFRAENAGSGALILLKEISESIPKDVEVEFTRYDFKIQPNGEGVLTLRAETEGFAQQDKVVRALEKVDKLGEVQDKGAKKKPGTDDIIDFEISSKFLRDGKG